jgi:hypothetical protein
MKQLLYGLCLFCTLVACNSVNSPTPPQPQPSAAPKQVASDSFVTAKGAFYCEGMVAADGLGCMIKIDGVVYKMQNENGILYEESSAFDKAGKPIAMEVVFKKTGEHFKMMAGNDGPELITIRSVKPLAP